jgi:hypothetical protein
MLNQHSLLFIVPVFMVENGENIDKNLLSACAYMLNVKTSKIGGRNIIHVSFAHTRQVIDLFQLFHIGNRKWKECDRICGW